MINNLNSFNSSSYNISPTNRFSPKQNSPRLTDTSNTISFTSLNVCGINDICKFDDILDDLITENLSIIGLQETRLTESNAAFMFKNFVELHHLIFDIRITEASIHMTPPEESALLFHLSSPNISRKFIAMTVVSSLSIYFSLPRNSRSLIFITTNREISSD